jgi:putative transposase
MRRSRYTDELSDPGKPWQNGSDESFNGKFRDESPEHGVVSNRHEAVPIIETWRQHYNEVGRIRAWTI